MLIGDNCFVGQIIHPERDLIRRKHDIAMLILDTVPPYTDFIRPICLPGPTIVSNLKVVFVAGWGSTTKNSDQLALSNVKLDARLDYINHTSCNRHYAAFRLNEVSKFYLIVNIRFADIYVEVQL